MKERTIRILVLAVVFVVAIVGFRIYLNRDHTDIIGDMETVSLPTLSFRAGGTQMNLIPGHVRKMDASAVRNVTTPIDGSGKLQMDIASRDRKISSVTYTVYARDGKNQLLEKKTAQVKDTQLLDLGSVLKNHREGLLCVQLNLGKQPVYYYTRVVPSEGTQFDGCMTFVRKLHSNLLHKKNIDEIQHLLETDTQANLSLQHVTIQSSVNHATWAELKPEVLGEVYYQVQEAKKEYTSVLLRYLVQCAGDDSKGTVYRVEEFFQVRIADGNQYLLAYDRTMEEEFRGGEAVLLGKGFKLGMTSKEVEYCTNRDGTIVAFVQANALWSYSVKDNEFAMIFNFSESEREDVRNHFQEHTVKILSMDDVGNVTFSVYGYMNRGEHEGESGAAIYYFDLRKNIVKETAFIPSTMSAPAIEEAYGELTYYNSTLDAVYVINDSRLYRIDLQTGEKTVVLEGLEQGHYVSSADGQMIAYPNSKEDSEAYVLDLSSGKTRSVSVAKEDAIRPLGFIRSDFVYGTVRPEDVLTTATGETLPGMYKMEICNVKNQILKTYEKDGIYILNVTFDSNRMNLQCARKKNGAFRSVEDDYISNNEEKSSAVSLQTYWSETRGNLYSIVFEDSVADADVKLLKPRQILATRDTKIELGQEDVREFYTVYGLGKILGVYEEAGDAIVHAKAVSGTVVSPKQNYVWETHSQAAWSRNFDLDTFAATVNQQLKTKTPADILEKYGGDEVVSVRRCSVSEMRYLIDKGMPVLAMTGTRKAVVLVGYDAQTVTYIEPGNNGAKSARFARFDNMIKNSGSIFFACTNNK